MSDRIKKLLERPEGWTEKEFQNFKEELRVNIDWFRKPEDWTEEEFQEYKREIKGSWLKKPEHWTEEEFQGYKNYVKVVLIVGLIATIILSIVLCNSPDLSEDIINFWSRF